MLSRLFSDKKQLPGVGAIIKAKLERNVREIVDAPPDDSAFDVAQLCRVMAMSHSQLHRKLSTLTGLAATKFIRHVRLSKAQELLHDDTRTVAAVADDTGFSDPSCFGRMFRQEFGVSPQEWREGAMVKSA
mgnify:CR=1 FL=1